MRIVHFSDIHAGGPIDHISGFFDKRILGTLNFYARRRHKHDWSLMGPAIERIQALEPDVVICTGDLASTSSPHEFDLAVAALRPLIDDTSFDLFCVPGNHDRYVANRRCAAAFDAAFTAVNRGRWGGADLPAKVVVDGLRMIFVDHAVPVGWRVSNGRVSDAAAAWLKAELATDDPAIKATLLANHYPIHKADGADLAHRRSCHNNEAVREAYADGRIDVVLCGHIHTPFARHDGEAAEYCGGSLTFARKLNILDYDAAAGTFDQQWIDVTA
jgi:3',5'-cyclic AMP phosphodiesterase CpdA